MVPEKKRGALVVAMDAIQRLFPASLFTGLFRYNGPVVKKYFYLHR